MTKDATLKKTTTERFIPCLDYIFSFLHQSDLIKTALVSREWHLYSSRRLWSHFRFVREREFERIFHVLSKRTKIQYGSYIISLELVHSDKDFCINSNHICLITMLCPNLASISISLHHTRTVAPPVAHLLINRKLQRPALPTQKPISPPSRYTQCLPLAHFAHNCPKLKSIRLVSYSPEADDSVYEMAKYLTSGSLESITFNSCPTIQSLTLCKLAMTNPQLKSVEFMGTTTISDSSLTSLVDRCGESLEYLSIGNAHELTDESMRYVALRCKNIRQICIFNNTERVSEDTLTAMITNCSTLQTISLSDSRCLGSTFFDSVVRRVNVEMDNIYQHQAQVGSGLQRLCLGAVNRDMIQSQYMQELIEKSASKNDRIQQQEDDDNRTTEDQLTHIIDTTKFMPISAVIRGSTVWWQRRRILITSST